MRKILLLLGFALQAAVLCAQAPLGLFRKPATPRTAPEAITTQPEGRLYDNLYRYSGAYEARSLGDGVFSVSDGVVSAIVVSDDGHLYLRDPFSRFANGAWIKGTLQGDTVTFDFPQYIYGEESGGYTLDCYVSRMILNSSQTSFILDPTSQQMKFLWKDGALTQLEDEPVMGMSAWIPQLNNMWMWVGYADYDVRITPAPAAPVAPPADVEPETRVLNFYPDDDNADYRMAKVVVDKEDIYIQGIANSQPDAWIRGTFDGDVAHFDAGQYLGISRRLNGYDPDQHIYMITATEQKTYTESGSYVSTYTPSRGIDFVVNPITGEMASKDVLVANAGTRRVYAEVIYRQPSVQFFQEMPGTPQAPAIYGLSEFSPISGYGLIGVVMPKLTTDGQRMNLDKLFYNLYIDDQPMTFYPDEYPYLDEEVVDMPYMHTDKRDFIIDALDHRIFFYIAGFDRMGVQMIYRGGGEEHRSPVVYYDPTGIRDAEQRSADSTGAAAYDLCGRQVQPTRPGIYIHGGKKYVVK